VSTRSTFRCRLWQLLWSGARNWGRFLVQGSWLSILSGRRRYWRGGPSEERCGRVRRCWGIRLGSIACLTLVTRSTATSVTWKLRSGSPWIYSIKRRRLRKTCQCRRSSRFLIDTSTLWTNTAVRIVLIRHRKLRRQSGGMIRHGLASVILTWSRSIPRLSWPYDCNWPPKRSENKPEIGSDTRISSRIRRRHSVSSCSVRSKDAQAPLWSWQRRKCLGGQYQISQWRSNSMKL